MALQLTSLAYTKNTTTLLNLGYAYTQNGGNNGQIGSITDNTGTQEAGRSVTYSYDALYRLSTAVTTGSTSYPKWGLSWTYDRYGNRLNQTQTFDGPPTNSVTVSAATNRITDPGYSYDANGNMTNDGANTMTYDAENRAVSAAGANYTYDGNSLRVKKVSGGTTTIYTFSGTKVIAEYSGTSSPYPLAREYIYSGSQLVATIEGSTTKYHHTDHLSVRLTTDTSGSKVGDQGHYPYGEVWYASSSTTKWQFTSYERDSESGNDYALLRCSVNRLGRFSSPDLVAGSVDDPQSQNRYAYVLNDPTNLMDPLGLCPQSDGTLISYNRADGQQIGASVVFVCDSSSMAAGGYGRADFPVLIYMGGRKGGGGSRQQTIQNIRSELYDRLLKDPDCLSFLGAKGAAVLATVSTIPISIGFVSTNNNIQAQTDYQSNPGSQIPTDPSITINENGWFFTRGATANQSGHLIRSGTPFMQAGVLLHELGHATGILAHDRTSAEAQEQNSQAIWQNCSKTLNSFSNK